MLFLMAGAGDGEAGGDGVISPGIEARGRRGGAELGMVATWLLRGEVLLWLI